MGARVHGDAKTNNVCDVGGDRKEWHLLNVGNRIRKGIIHYASVFNRW